MSSLPRRKGKEIPRLPLSAFTPPNTGTSDTFPIPPTPSLVSPRGIVDAHLQISLDHPCNIDVAHLKRIDKRAIVLSPRTYPAETIIAALQSLHSVEAPVLSVLVPFALDATQVPDCISEIASPTLTTTYNGAAPVAAEVEGENKDHPQVESAVTNLRWALQRGRVVELGVKDGIIAISTSVYDSLVNLLSKAITSDTNRIPIVLTNVLPPPLDSVTPVVTMMNHPSYNTYRQRISSLSLFENVSVKLLPPAWASVESIEASGDKQERELRNLLKLFIVPVLEAFGFERIIFGSSPAFTDGSPALSEIWYRLVLESFRELAISQDEMNKIFLENAERVYEKTQ